MTKKLGFVTMRAQGFHSGHRDLIRKAKAQCDKLLILLGSVNLPQTPKNPFTYEQRKEEITRFLDHEFSFVIAKGGFEIFPVNTYVYSDSQWITDVTELVTEVAREGSYDEIIMFGHKKPGNDYLSWFPNFKYINIEGTELANGTELRDYWFKNERHRFSSDVLADYDYFIEEDKNFANYPYPNSINVMCGDAIVECSGHILLIKRRKAPGRNTWALPGGHKNSNESTFECVIRELMEETNLRVPEKVLRGSVVASQLFDAPDRGCGRIPKSTLAVHFKIGLNNDGTLPRFSPADDAIDGEWVPTGDALNRLAMHDDHAGILMTMLKVMPVPAHKNPRFVNAKHN